MHKIRGGGCDQADVTVGLSCHRRGDNPLREAVQSKTNIRISFGYVKFMVACYMKTLQSCESEKSALSSLRRL